MSQREEEEEAKEKKKEHRTHTSKLGKEIDHHKLKPSASMPDSVQL